MKGYSIQNRIESLPLIICGPILRKVHYRSVTVMVVFKSPIKNASLDIYEYVEYGPQTLVGRSQSFELITLGDHIHLCYLTAIPEGKSATFKESIFYEYDISFTVKDEPKNQYNFGSEGVFKGGIKTMIYPPFSKPSFTIPPNDVNDLKICQGSCRKLHGGQTDALHALDAIISINSLKYNKRPHLLFLTGDQIYADEVSNLVLELIIDAEEFLIGKNKYGTSGKPGSFNPTNERLPHLNIRNVNPLLGTGKRAKLIASTKNRISPDDLSSSAAENHVITLGEYIMLYIFSWSHSIWPTENVIKKITMNRTKFYNKREKIITVVKTLPLVTRALANISSLMIFDDHDVTDDWFLSKEWIEISLMPNSLSRRLILNGLLSYSLFQDYGNQPLDYKSEPKKSIIYYMKTNLLKNGHIPSKKFEDKILPKTPLGIKKDKNFGDYYFSDGPLKWHYLISYNSYDILALDTRTHRGYFIHEMRSVAKLKLQYPNLVSNLDLQIPQRNKSKKLLLLLSAAPVIGNVAIESQQRKASRGEVPFKKSWKGMYEKDAEAWSLSGAGFYNLLRKLSIYKNVIVFSGDVHYSFSAYARLNNAISNTETNLIQLTGSSLKNSNNDTHTPASNSHTIAVIDLGWTVQFQPKKRWYHYCLWLQEGKYVINLPDLKIETIGGKPASSIINEMYRLRKYYNYYNLQYSIKFIKDKSRRNARRYMNKLKKYLSDNKMSYKESLFNEKNFHPVIVGKDNISVVSFLNNDGSIIKVYHELWYPWGYPRFSDKIERNFPVIPYAIHEIDIPKLKTEAKKNFVKYINY